MRQRPFITFCLTLLATILVTGPEANAQTTEERPNVVAGPSMGGAVRMASKGRGYGMGFRGLNGDVLPVIGTDAAGAAAKGGLLAGDTIVAMNGTPVKDLDNAERMAALRGSPLVLLVNRDGEELELTLSLEGWAPAPAD